MSSLRRPEQAEQPPAEALSGAESAAVVPSACTSLSLRGPGRANTEERIAACYAYVDLRVLRQDSQDGRCKAPHGAVPPRSRDLAGTQLQGGVSAQHAEAQHRAA